MKVTIDLASVGHTERLKYFGILDIDGLFKTMYQWYDDYGYEFHEKTVKHKVPGPLGADQEIEWTGWRKINGYVMFWVDVYFHLWQLKDVEVVKEGKKTKVCKARMLIEFSGKVDLDYSNRFAGSRFLQALQDWYHKFVIKKEIDTIYTDQLYYRILKLYTVAKEYLDMEAKSNASRGRW